MGAGSRPFNQTARGNLRAIERRKVVGAQQIGDASHSSDLGGLGRAQTGDQGVDDAVDGHAIGLSMKGGT